MFNPLKRLTHSPKHHLVDPALAACLVGVAKAGLLTGEGDRAVASTGTWLGALFESLAAQSVRIYADGASARVGHLRTKETDREIDLIVEGEDRRVVAIEVKPNESVSDKGVPHLNWLDDKIGARPADRLLITTGDYACRRTDGVAVVLPLALLGPQPVPPRARFVPDRMAKLGLARVRRGQFEQRIHYVIIAGQWAVTSIHGHVMDIHGQCLRGIS